MVDHQKKIADIALQDPNVATIMSSVGASGSSVSTNTGRLMMRLKPRNERSLSVDELIQKLRRNLPQFPDPGLYAKPPTIRIGGYFTKSQYQYTLQSPDIDDLYKYAPFLRQN